MSGTFGLSLAQRGSPHAVAASDLAPSPSAEWANIRERSSTLGQLTLTSTATMARPAPLAARRGDQLGRRAP